MRCLVLLEHSLGCSVQSALLATQHSLDDIGQVLEQMKAISHLHCAWSSTSDSFGEGPGPITGDELESWLGFQPGGQSRSRSIRQQVDNFVRLEVDQDGAEYVSLPLRPVIHTQSHDRFDRRQRSR